MTVNEALEKLRKVDRTLGIPYWETRMAWFLVILESVEQYGYDCGYTQARETVGDWYEPRPLGH